jgi:hypothetical protein
MYRFMQIQGLQDAGGTSVLQVMKCKHAEQRERIVVTP